VADAGLHHAVALIPWGWDFNPQLSCGSPPCTVVSDTTFPSAAGFTYTVTAKNDPIDPSPTNDANNLIILLSTALGPDSAKKEIQAYVNRSSGGFVPPGAIYLPANSATITFDSGTGFFITGNDTDYNGSPPASPKPAVYGVAPIHDSVGNQFKTALGSSRYNLVQGSGYSAGPPVSPSIITTSNVLDVNQIALNFYNYPGTVKYLDGLQLNCSSSSPCTLGTDLAPQITYIREGTKHVHLDGYVSGAGVLVVEGKTHLYGEFNFHGLVITVPLGLTGGTSSPDDDPDPVSLKNNAKIFGGLLMGPTNGNQRLGMRNSVKIYYSSRAMTMVNSLCSTCLPQPARVVAWLDKQN